MVVAIILTVVAVLVIAHVGCAFRTFFTLFIAAIITIRFALSIFTAKSYWQVSALAFLIARGWWFAKTSCRVTNMLILAVAIVFTVNALVSITSCCFAVSSTITIGDAANGSFVAVDLAAAPGHVFFSAECVSGTFDLGTDLLDVITNVQALDFGAVSVRRACYSVVLTVGSLLSSSTGSGVVVTGVIIITIVVIST
jgi:hypothetical protein